MKEFSLVHELNNCLKIKSLVQKLNSTERRDQKIFQNFCRNFLGNEKAENYSDNLKELISSYSAVACNVSLKANFLLAHFDFFLKTWMPSPMNVTKGFRQDISQTGKKYKENGVQTCWLSAVGIL